METNVKMWEEGRWWKRNCPSCGEIIVHTVRRCKAASFAVCKRAFENKRTCATCRNKSLGTVGSRAKLKGNQSSQWKGYGKISMHYYNQVKKTAETRNRTFDITIQQMSDLFDKQNGKCALTGLSIGFDTMWNKETRCTNSLVTASLDRMDSSRGYVEGNIQWVHKDINIMKSNHTIEYFTHLCNLVSDHKRGT